jgi:thiamine biosynthesis lipoprotein
VSNATASWRVFGTTATVVVTDKHGLAAARTAVEAELAAIDAACSRFRPDAELVRLNRAAGAPVTVGPLLMDAIETALHAARITGGLVDPTVGAAMDAIGYDRDLLAIAPDGPAIDPVPAPGWRTVNVDREHRAVWLAGGTRLDLGATAKAWAADRSARRASEAGGGGGVLVGLGGDMAVAGPPPPEGWAIGIADDHEDATAATTVSISSGGLATSSTTVRGWRRGGNPVHHIVDPASGLPARVVWRTVSVAAASCVDANAAATAAIVRGPNAPAWLEDSGLPARLVAADGSVVTTAAWPAEELVA